MLISFSSRFKMSNDSSTDIIASAGAPALLCMRWVKRERERERERERQTDGCDVTIVALKLAISLHFSLGKNFALFVSIVVLKLAMILHLPLPRTRTFRLSFHTSRLSCLKWSP